MAIQIAVVGASFRKVPTHVRAAMVELDMQPDVSPTQALLNSGYIRGFVRVATCSRSEWIIAAESPKWSADLLRSAFIARLPLLKLQTNHLHVKSGLPALEYLYSFACGLDSLAQGEAAVSRQVLKAFEEGHEDGHLDRSLNLLWNHLGRLVHSKRALLPCKSGVGVQQLVAAELFTRRISLQSKIVLFGLGHIGLQIVQALKLRGYSNIKTFGRATMADFMHKLSDCDVLVISSGAPEAWLTLPLRADSPLCIDVGSPIQIQQADGWQRVDLDTLLAQPAFLLPSEEYERLSQVVELAINETVDALGQDPAALKHLERIRREFLHERLSELLQGVEQPAVAQQIKKRVYAMTHEWVQKVRVQK